LGQSVGATFPIIADTDRSITDRYGVAATPYNIIVGRTGKVEQTLEGFAPGELERVVSQVVGSS